MTEVYNPYTPQWWSRDKYRIVTTVNVRNLIPLDIFDWHNIPDIIVDDDRAIAVLTITDGANTDDGFNMPIGLFPYKQGVGLVERSLRYKPMYSCSWRGYEVIGVIPTINVRRDIEWLKEFFSVEHPFFKEFYIPQDVGDLMFIMRCVFLSWQAHIDNTRIQHYQELINNEETIEALELKIHQHKIEHDEETKILRSELKDAKHQIKALQIKLETQKTGRDTSGYIYLLHVHNANNLYKIGRTKNPQSRLITFKSKLPFEVEYNHLIKTDDMYELESKLHSRFADKRQNGSEFFLLTFDDVAYIKSL